RLARKPPSRRYPYGYHRAEDVAGLAIVAFILVSAVVAGIEAIQRLIHPQGITPPGLVLAAGFVGFAGNEAVAAYRIRVGRRIGSAALVADGLHARVDGVEHVADARARWSGHRLLAELNVAVLPTLTVHEGHAIADDVHHALLDEVPRLADVMVHVDPHDHDPHG